MKTIKFRFDNAEGEELAARLELLVDKQIKAYALFAHCFTCTKNLMAVTNISRALTSKGIAVLRFDFTGLGESEGEFADTNFSGNVQDLLCAADYLKDNYEAPKVIMGHSLGGAAALMAAEQLDYIEAVATVGAPSDVPHVEHLFQDSVEEINKNGLAKVLLGGRPFTIKKQFIDDLEQNDLISIIPKIRKPLLILHSPQDDTVGISNAEKIYHAAYHPKSYISLDGADHLLTDKDDASYVGEVIASWAIRYLPKEAIDPLETDHQVVLRNEEDKGFLTEIMASGHYYVADEPKSIGGTDLGGNPYDMLLSSLGACTAITIRMYAKHKGLPLEEVKVHMNRKKKHSVDAQELGANSMIEFIDREIELTGDLSTEQRQRILEIGDKCPVHKTLSKGITINSVLKE